MKYIIVVIGLLLINQLQAQEENWQNYIATFENKPGSVIVNMQLKEVAPIKKLPIVLVVGVTYSNCSEDGFPEKNAFDQLYQIADSIQSWLPLKAAATLVGSFTHNCQRLDYYYITDSSNIRKTLLTKLEKIYPEFPPYLNIKLDASWTYYLDFLYPNEYYEEFIKNQQVVLQLMKSGDSLTKERIVEHWIYFSTEKDRTCFLEQIKSDGFTIDEKRNRSDLTQSYQLKISRKDSVDPYKITTLTLELRKKAATCKGDYDGWETIVVKD